MATATPATVAAAAKAAAARRATREGLLRRAELAAQEGNARLAAQLRQRAAAC